MSNNIKTKVTALVGEQEGLKIYTFFMSPKDIRKIATEELFDGTKKKGIQRHRTPSDISTITHNYENKKIYCTNSISINDRNGVVQIKKTKNNPHITQLTIPLNQSLSLTDGGLRTKALSRIKENNFQLSVNLTQMTKNQEALSFTIDNRTQTKCSKGLEAGIYAGILDDAPDLLHNKQKNLSVIWSVVRALNNREDSPLYDMMYTTNKYDTLQKYKKSDIRNNPSLKNKRKINFTSWFEGLQKVLLTLQSDPEFYFKDITDHNTQASLLSLYLVTFWKTLRSVTPQQIWNNPDLYTFFQQPGVKGTTLLLQRIMIDMKNKNKKDFQSENSYKEYIKKIPIFTNHKRWYNRKAWQQHPDCPQDTNNPAYKTGWREHSDFHRCWIGMTGRGAGKTVADELWQDYLKNS